MDFNIKIDCSREYLVNHIPNQEPAFRSRFHQTLVAQRQVRWLEHISTSAEVRKKNNANTLDAIESAWVPSKTCFLFSSGKMSYDPWLTAVVQRVGFIPSFTNIWFVVLVEFRQLANACHLSGEMLWVEVADTMCIMEESTQRPFSSLTIVTLESGSNSIGTKKWHFIYTDLLTFGEIFCIVFSNFGMACTAKLDEEVFPLTSKMFQVHYVSEMNIVKSTGIGLLRKEGQVLIHPSPAPVIRCWRHFERVSVYWSTERLTVWTVKTVSVGSCQRVTERVTVWKWKRSGARRTRGENEFAGWIWRRNVKIGRSVEKRNERASWSIWRWWWSWGQTLEWCF